MVPMFCEQQAGEIFWVLDMVLVLDMLALHSIFRKLEVSMELHCLNTPNKMLWWVFFRQFCTGEFRYHQLRQQLCCCTPYAVYFGSVNFVPHFLD